MWAKHDQEIFTILNSWYFRTKLTSGFQTQETALKNIDFRLIYGFLWLEVQYGASTDKLKQNTFSYDLNLGSHKSVKNQYFLMRFLLFESHLLALYGNIMN